MRPRGFTLIELLVVIAIIGLLSSIVLAALNTARQKGRDAVRESNLHQLQTALQLYANDHNGQYPVTGVGVYNSECTSPYFTTVSAANVIPGLVPTYIASFPEDPSASLTTPSDCILYISQYGTDYKVIDWHILDSPNPGGPKALIDPSRNYSLPWANPQGCSPYTGDPYPSWAIWSSSASMCL